MNQKHLPFWAALALLACSCSIKEPRMECLAPVSVHLTGFTTSQEDFPTTKTTATPENYEGINALTLAFYSGSTEVEKITQLKSDDSTYDTFGEFSLSLPCDSYTLVAVAYYISDGTTFTLTSPTAAAFSGNRAYETFVCSQEVNINTTRGVDLEITLERIIAQLKVVSTDGKTANVTNVKMTFSAGGKSFNPSTGLATSNTGFINTVGNSAAVEAHSTSSSFLFLATDEQTIDVTIETLDSEGNTLFSETITDVPFKRNRVTKLSGDMYTNTGVGGSFLLNTGWITTEEVEF